MSSKFFTNRNDKTLINKFEGLFKHNPEIRYFDVLVGYFYSSGYFKIRHLLNNLKQIRILVGIDVDKCIQEAINKNHQFDQVEPDILKEEYSTIIRNDVENSDYKKEINEGISKFVEDLQNGKLLIKAHPSKKLHSKIYIFKPEDFNEHTPASVIMGSSNLTGNGIGIHDIKHNYEFNVELKNYDDVKFASDEFEVLWNESVEIGFQDIKENLPTDTITPYEAYLKVLIEYFGNSVEQGKLEEEELPKSYDDYAYQRDAVADGYEKLKRHNGFILADVVGLGKTIIAVRIMRKYLEENYNSRILVVIPKALIYNWEKTLADFKIKDSVHLVTNGSLHKVLEEKDNYLGTDYDMVVVDESHGFKNYATQKYELLNRLCNTRSRKDNRKKVILLSATPLNNEPSDIKNQLYLFQDKYYSTISGIDNLEKFFSDKEKKYKEVLKEKPEIIQKTIKNIYIQIKDRVLTELVIRRTRTDILSIERYKQDIKQQGLKFPETPKPEKLEYKFDDELIKTFSKTVKFLKDNAIENNVIENKDNKNESEPSIEYFRYRAIEFLKKPKHKKCHENNNMSVEKICALLRALMENGLIKRLESSFYAFKKSLANYQQANENMIMMFENDRIFIAPDINVNQYLEEHSFDELQKKIDKLDSNNTVYKKNDFKDSLLEGLKQDKKYIEELMKEWNEITQDPKIDKFIEQLDNLLKKNSERKLVVFTESKQTAIYLKKTLDEKLNNFGENKKEYSKNDKYKFLEIDSTNSKQQFDVIKENFDANLAKKQQKNNYNIIITTEVLAEGVNLHRSNVILNYDVPWNSTKLMQRIGRVNRIGTKAKKVFVYNFYPSEQSNKRLGLNERTLAKIQGFHSSFGEDNKVYSEDEELAKNTLNNISDEYLEEKDESLTYKEIVRDLYENDRTEYNRIKKLTVKINLARKNKKLANSYISYLKNNYKEAFYFYDNKQDVEEIRFIDAIKIFEATTKEESAKLTNQHYEVVEKFKSQLKGDSDTEINTITKIPPNINKAINIIKSIQKIKDAKFTIKFSIDLKQLRKALTNGRFVKIYREINKLDKFDNATKVEKIKQLIDKYKIKDANFNDEQNKNFGLSKVVIIEGFIN